MDRTNLKIALLPLLLLLTGCGIEHELDLSKIDKLKYAPEGGVALPQPQLLSTQSKEFTDLIEWLEQNRSGWQPLQATLLPGGLSIHGESFALRVIHQTAILHYRDESGEYRLLQKKIPANRFAFLME